MYLLLRENGDLEIIDSEKEDSYELFHRYIHGHLDCVSYIPTLKGFDLWIDDEFRYKDLKPTLAIKSEDNLDVEDIFCGNIIFAKSDEEGTTIPLEKEDVEIIISKLRSRLIGYRINLKTGGKEIINIPVV